MRPDLDNFDHIHCFSVACGEQPGAQTAQCHSLPSKVVTIPDIHHHSSLSSFSRPSDIKENLNVFNSNEAVEEWKVDNMGEGLLDGGDVNTVYR